MEVIYLARDIHKGHRVSFMVQLALLCTTGKIKLKKLNLELN